MIHDTLKPKITPYDKHHYILTESWIYICDETGIVIKVPAGFLSDGTSIPKAIQTKNFQPYLPQFMGPGIIHDYLYRNHIKSRKESDKAIRYALLLNGVNRFQVWTIYMGLRIGGYHYWKKHKA